MNKTIGLHIWPILFANAIVLSSCSAAMSIGTPTPDWRTSPTYVYYVPPSDASEYRHYTPSKLSKIPLEFDYPSYWLLHEYINEIGIPSISLDDAGFLTLATPFPPDNHPKPNDLGSIYIWIMPSKPGQTPETELISHKQGYSITHWITVLKDYKTTLNGRDAYVLEYQTDDPETSPSLMFNRRIYFMVNNQVYEIIYTVAEKDRGGEFDKGYEYFFNSITIAP